MSDSTRAVGRPERDKTSAEKTTGSVSVTLTDEEREAVAYFASFQWTHLKPQAAALRGLLERLA